MKYYSTLKECQAANPSAKWFYKDRNGIGGMTRWFASKRILKAAKQQLEKSGYSPEAAFKQGFNFFSL
jgi:hypothetical protein